MESSTNNYSGYANIWTMVEYVFYHTDRVLLLTIQEAAQGLAPARGAHEVDDSMNFVDSNYG